MMKKRLLPTLLACLTALALLPLTAFAADGFRADCGALKYYFEPDQHTAVVCGRAAENTEPNITIPATVTYGDDEYTVTGIDDGAFQYDSNITSLTVAEGITRIEAYAFERCAKLAEITLPDSVTSVKKSSFQDTAYYKNDKKWENGVLYIGKCLIAGRNNVMECVVKDGTVAIAGSAFEAPSEGNDLTSVTIPASVVTIGGSAFEKCGSLANVSFANAENSSLKMISNSAFEYCSSLSAIDLPASVDTIENDAFCHTGLTSVVLPEGLKVIRGSLFKNCGSLTEVTIPSTVTEIWFGAFDGCDELTTIHFGGSQAQWEAITGSGKPSTPHVEYLNRHSITVIKGDADVTIRPRAAATGEIVTVTCALHHVYDSVTVTGPGDSVIDQTPIPDVTPGVRKFSFTMPAGDVMVDVKTEFNIEDAVVDLSKTDFTYNGSVQKPAIITIGGMPLTEGTDYTAEWPNPDSKDVGTYTVTVTGTGDCYGRTQATYTIIPAKVTVPTGKTLTYNGKSQTGVEAGANYTIGGNTATNAGSYTATLALTDKDNYKWSDDTTDNQTVTWEISPAKVTVPNGKTLTYNGKAQTGVAADANYTVTENTATNAGSYTATLALKDKKNYLWSVETTDNQVETTDDQTVSWKINKASLKDKKLVLAKTAYTWNGKVQKPTVKTVGGKALKSGTDYTVKYSNASSTAAGSYTVTVTGKGNYTGTSAKATYKINKAANPLAIKAATATVKYSAVKAKAQTLAVSKVISFTKKGQGTMTYTKASGNAKITINKTTGKITVKKGLAKGTYKVKLTAKAAGNANYKASAVKTVTGTIIVK